MSEQSNNFSGFGQAVKVHAEAIVTRNGKPVEENPAPATVQED